MITHLIGLDLGQSVDYSAACVMRRVWTFPGRVYGRAPEPGTARLHHEVVALLRWALGTPYDRIVQNVEEMATKVRINPDSDGICLVVDQSGVGRPVVDMLRRRKLSPRAITITSGTAVSERDDDMTVPKAFIASAFIVAAQNGTLKVAGTLSFAKELETEINAFGYTVNRKSATVSYESQKDMIHDDLVVACALPYWYSVSKIGTSWGGARDTGAEVEEMASPL